MNAKCKTSIYVEQCRKRRLVACVKDAARQSQRGTHDMDLEEMVLSLRYGIEPTTTPISCLQCDQYFSKVR